MEASAVAVHSVSFSSAAASWLVSLLVWIDGWWTTKRGTVSRCGVARRRRRWPPNDDVLMVMYRADVVSSGGGDGGAMVVVVVIVSWSMDGYGEGQERTAA